MEVEGRRGIGKGRREGRRAKMKGKGGVYTVEIEVDGGESGRPRVVRRLKGREWRGGKGRWRWSEVGREVRGARRSLGKGRVGLGWGGGMGRVGGIRLGRMEEESGRT